MKKGNTDTVPAMLTPGEAILNRNAAEIVGRTRIKKLNAMGNRVGYQTGTSNVKRDDKADLLREIDTAIYGQLPIPTPTPTPRPIRGYQYGTDDVRRRRNAASRVGSSFSDTGVAGGAYLALPLEQNPAYQAALAKGRPNRSGYTMISTPSGGSMAVPIGQERKYTDLLFKGNPTADTGFQRPNPQAAYGLGDTGAVPTGNTPYERSYRMGFQGEGPVQQPQPSFGFQVGNTLRNAAPGIIPTIQNAASRVAQGIGNFFGGGTPAATAYGAGLQPDTNNPPIPPPPPIVNQALQSVQAMQQGATAQQSLPRRYSDYY